MYIMYVFCTPNKYIIWNHYIICFCVSGVILFPEHYVSLCMYTYLLCVHIIIMYIMYVLCILHNLTTIEILYIFWKHHIICACVSGVILCPDFHVFHDLYYVIFMFVLCHLALCVLCVLCNVHTILCIMYS
jgi:hypothetical protein